MSTNRIAEILVRRRMNESVGDRAPQEYLKKAEEVLNHQLGEYETGVRVLGGRIRHEAPGKVTLKVEYDVDIKIPIIDPVDHTEYYETETEYRTQTLTIEI